MNVYHFDALTEKGNWDHLNSYFVEGDYGNTITQELVETLHKEGKFAHQELDEMLSGWVEFLETGTESESIDVFDWFNV